MTAPSMDIPRLLRRALAWRIFYSATSFAAGVLRFFALGAGVILIAELFQPTPPGARHLLWALAALLSAWVAGRGRWRGFAPSALARDVGASLRPPDLLANARELSAAGRPSAFLDRELAALAAQSAALSPARTLRPTRWNIHLGLAAVAVGALALFFFFPQSGVRFAARRVLWPWSAEDAWVTLRPGDLRVPAGENVPVTVLPRLPGGLPHLYVRRAGGAWEERGVSSTGDGSFRAVLERVTEPLRYRVRHRGLWSVSHTLTPYLPLRFERLRLTVHAPAHTGRPVDTLEGALSLRLPQGSWVQGEGRLDRDVLKASLAGPAGPVPLDVDGGRDISFRFQARQGGAWVFSLQSTEGDATEIPLQVDAVPDEPPTVVLLSPEGDAAVSPRERLPVVYELNDDHGLVAARLRLTGPDGLDKTILLPVESGMGEKLLVPAKLGLVDGDKALLWIEVQDANPSAAGKARSAVVTVTVSDEGAALERTLEKLDRWRSGLWAAKTDEETLAAKLKNADVPWGELAARQRLAQEGIQELTDNLKGLAQSLETQRGGDPWLAAEHRAIHEALEELMSRESPRLAEAMGRKDAAASKDALDNISQELGRLAQVSEEAQATSRARDAAGRENMEDAARDLAELLKDPLSAESGAEAQALMREIAEEMRRIAQAFQDRPDLLGPPGENVDPSRVLKMEDMMKNLAEAARAAQAGDAKGAAEAARRLLEQVRALREILSRAGERMAGEGGLSGAAGEEWRQLQEALGKIIENQESLKSGVALLWDGAYLRLRAEQERILSSTAPVSLPSSPSLTSAETVSLSTRAAAQERLRGDTLAVRELISALSRRTARMGARQAEKVEAAAAAMSRAAGHLRDAAPPEAMAEQEAALRLLRETQSSMESASRGGGTSSGGLSASRPFPGGGAGGLRPEGPTRLPRAKDYKPSKEFRDDILRALEEKYPAQDKGVIEDYFKRWKK